MKQTPTSLLIERYEMIERLEMRNMAVDYMAFWCRECLLCEITPVGGGRNASVTMHEGNNNCDFTLKFGHLAECIRDLKGETE